MIDSEFHTILASVPQEANMKTKAMASTLSRVPKDPYGAFAWFVSHCASGLYGELLKKGHTDTEARNAVIGCFLDFAGGEACRIARREGRAPDPEKWRAATDAAFDRALKRTEEPTATESNDQV